jgi:hypothetical protein
MQRLGSGDGESKGYLGRREWVCTVKERERGG